jgi:hypothetical protein
MAMWQRPPTTPDVRRRRPTRGARSQKAAAVEHRVLTATQTNDHAFIDAELTSVIGAGPWERTEHRTTQRNGSRARTLTTTAGDLELRMPRLRAGRLPRCSSGAAGSTRHCSRLETCLHGVSMRKLFERGLEAHVAEVSDDGRAYRRQE